MISRMNAGRDSTSQEWIEWEKQLRAFDERHPGEREKLILTANEKRAALRSYQIELPDGMAYGELPLIKFTPLIHKAVERVARKLTLALHYKHTTKIVPSDAWVHVVWRTNVHKVANAIPEELFKLFPIQADLHRDQKSLGDQFSYTFSISDNGELGGYVAMFRQVFLVIGIVVFDASSMRNDDGNQLEKVVNENADGLGGNA